MQGYRYANKVDVIPVINVSLVVVLTLMLIAPHLNDSEQQVTLPEATASEVDDADNVEITCMLDGRILFGDEQITLEEIRPLLAAALEQNQAAVAVIKADEALLYGDVRRVLAAVEAASVPRVAIATRNRPGPGGGSQ